MEEKLILQNQILIMKALHALVDDEGYKHLAEELKKQINVTEVAVKDDEEVKLRTKEQWLTECNEMLKVFGDTIKQYFGEQTLVMLRLFIKSKDSKKLYNRLNDIWLKLPDSKFNIEENPPGWNEFLGCVEFYNMEESKAILK